MFCQLFRSSLISFNDVVNFQCSSIALLFVKFIAKFYSFCCSVNRTVPVLFLDFLLVLHRNTIDSYGLIVYPETLLKVSYLLSLIVFSEFIRIFIYKDHLKMEIVLLISGRDSFYFLSCPATLARSDSTMLNRSDERRHLCVVPV